MLGENGLTTMLVSFWGRRLKSWLTLMSRRPTTAATASLAAAPSASAEGSAPSAANEGAASPCSRAKRESRATEDRGGPSRPGCAPPSCDRERNATSAMARRTANRVFVRSPSTCRSTHIGHSAGCVGITCQECIHPDQGCQTSAAALASSPDGSRIAFESFRDGQSEVYVV